MSGGLCITDFLTQVLRVILLYPFINQACFPLYSYKLPFYLSTSYDSMLQSGLLQREGKASLRICQGRAYGGYG